MTNGVLLWDFGNTLVRTDRVWSKAALRVLEGAGLANGVTLERIRPHLASGFPWHTPDVAHREAGPDAWWPGLRARVLDPLFTSFGAREDSLEHLGDAYRRIMLDPETWPVFEDTVPTLERLSSAGWRHAILSNFFPELEVLVDGLGLARQFEQVFSSGLVGYEKPRPEFFQHALARLGHPDVVWMIGDNIEHDMLGARAQGIPGILVRERGDWTPSSLDLHGVFDIVHR